MKKKLLLIIPAVIILIVSITLVLTKKTDNPKQILQDNKVEEFNIKILSVRETKDKLKNIEIEVIDSKLLEKTNGVVQGMSGSPIIQGEYIVGAVTHVVVDNPHKGYGILIKNMLEEAEN